MNDSLPLHSEKHGVTVQVGSEKERLSREAFAIKSSIPNVAPNKFDSTSGSLDFAHTDIYAAKVSDRAGQVVNESRTKDDIVFSSEQFGLPAGCSVTVDNRGRYRQHCSDDVQNASLPKHPLTDEEEQREKYAKLAARG